MARSSEYFEYIRQAEEDRRRSLEMEALLNRPLHFDLPVSAKGELPQVPHINRPQQYVPPKPTTKKVLLLCPFP